MAAARCKGVKLTNGIDSVTVCHCIAFIALSGVLTRQTAEHCWLLVRSYRSPRPFTAMLDTSDVVTANSSTRLTRFAAEAAAPDRRMRVRDNDEDERRKKVSRTENNRAMQTCVTQLPVFKIRYLVAENIHSGDLKVKGPGIYIPPLTRKVTRRAAVCYSKWRTGQH